MKTIIDVISSVVGPHLSPDFESGPPAEVIAQEAIKALQAEGYSIIDSGQMVESMIKSGQIPVVDDPVLLPPQPGDKKIQSPGHFLSGTQSPIEAYFDGNGNAINGKPGLAQWRIYTPDGQMFPGLKEYPVDTPNMTNNFLEYQGLIHCLESLIGLASQPYPFNGLSRRDLVIKGDSMLVVMQTKGLWRVKEQRLMPLRDRAQALLAQVQTLYRSVELKQCPSAENLCDPHA
jgi:ribonuclease HI